MQFHRPPIRIQYIKVGEAPPAAPFSDRNVQPERFLDIPRADTNACVTAVQGVAAQLGATASITEQNQRGTTGATGLSLSAEQCVGGALTQVLSTCPQVAKIAGLGAADLQATCEASKETVLIAEQAGQLRRGAREAGFVLGQSLVAVLDLARDGLITLINQGGAADQVAAVQADFDRIDAPLRLAAQQPTELNQAGRRAGADQVEAIALAKDQRRFDAIVAALRERGAAAVSAADILWAGEFSAAHPPAPPEPDKASNRRAKGR